ncbi:MAG: glycosyltransferase [Desulfobacteraceae bacterium]|nr:glycosyltransferase [Desulfobacteraceae bacterium]
MAKSCDIDLSVIVLNEGRLARELRDLDMPVFVVDEQAFSFPGLVFRIRTLMRQLSPDVAHSHRYKENILAVLARGVRGGSRLIATQHGMPEGSGKRFLSLNSFVSGLNKYLLANQFDRLVVVSDDMRKSFINEFGFAVGKVETIHNGIELHFEVRPGNKGSMLTVGSAGRFFPVKDYPLMVEIARAIKERGFSSVRFELAGEGPQRSLLEERISSYGLEDVFLLRGHVSDMDEFYSCIDVFLNTSVHEGIPMSILEAMSHGVPVVAPRVGGIREIITDGVDGFLVPGRNPADFAEKVIFFGRNHEAVQNMGRAARSKVEREYSSAAMAGKYMSLYQEVCHVGGQRTGEVL